MPFDPNLPAPLSPNASAEMRAQLTGLKELIDALAAGTVTGAVIDSVTTVNPGDAATVSVTVIGPTLHLAFSIPRGADGAPGAPGSIINGAQVDGVATLNPGDPATAGATYDGSLLRFAFGIPRGADGTNGAPGEVTNAALAAAIDGAVTGSSANSNAIPTLDTPFADPDAEALRNRFNELVLGLRRP